MTAYVDQFLGCMALAILDTYKESFLRSQVEKNHEVFEEVTMLDLKTRYGSTEAGRTINILNIKYIY